MSKNNKANKNNYSQAGRLTPDEMARERINQGEQSRLREDASADQAGERVTGKARPGERASSRPRSAPEEPA